MSMFRVLALIILATPAAAHDWYPPECCSATDCAAVGAADLTPTPEGWRVESSGEIVPFDDQRVKPIPPDAPPEARTTPHVCHAGGDPSARAICVYPMELGS
jgi:hypothetical protein